MAVSSKSINGLLNNQANVLTYATVNMSVANTWTQLVASTSVPIYVIALRYGFIGSGSNQSVVVELGTGAAGSEIVIATSIGANAGSICGMVDDHRVFAIPIRVAAGTRLAFRESAGGMYALGIAYVLESGVL